MPIISKALFLERLNFSRQEIEQVDGLLSYVSGKINEMWSMGLNPGRLKFIRDFLFRKIRSLEYKTGLYKKFLHGVGARLVIKEEACYGQSTSLIEAAKTMGIVTAEYQHGAISKGHDAYNYSEVLQKSKIIHKFLPEYFLGYGKWWNNQINAPVKKLAIGNPYRSLMLNKLKMNDFNKILVLGDGADAEDYLLLSVEISKITNGRVGVVFRPHPLEVAYVRERFKGKDITGVSIVSDGSIYDAFYGASVVVGEVSTGLFEAIGLVDKIFRWDTPKARFAYPDHPFDTFTDVSELAEKIRDPRAGRVSLETVDEIWAPNWQENYRSFLEQVGCL